MFLIYHLLLKAIINFQMFLKLLSYFFKTFPYVICCLSMQQMDQLLLLGRICVQCIVQDFILALLLISKILLLQKCVGLWE